MQETMIDYKQNIYQELSRLTKGLGRQLRELRMRRVSLLLILRATFRF